MTDILNVYKEIAQTPLEAISRLRKAKNIPDDVPITYAGRLDPMAEGVLLLLTGDAVHQKEEYLPLEKEYTFEMLFGFSTDTYDLLGCPIESDTKAVDEEALGTVVESMIGTSTQAYPPYSSKPVGGKPLFQWAREGKLGEITIPSQEIQIASFVLSGKREISGKDVLKEIQRKVNLVRGDFRQDEILRMWEASIDPRSQNTLVQSRVVCSSGTYVRGLVHDIGVHLGIPATTYSIVRNRVGPYRVEDALHI